MKEEKEDWKSFWINNPWAPRRLIQRNYKVSRSTIDNWVRKPKVKALLRTPEWSLTLNQTPSNIKRIFTLAWEYHITTELEINLESKSAPEKLIKIKNLRKGSLNFLIDPRYMSLIPGGRTWMDKGFTAVSYGVCNLFPGEKYCRDKGIIAPIFINTFTKILDHIPAIAIVEHIYLNFISNLNNESTTTEIINAKKQFVIRHDENGFFSSREAKGYGLGANMVKEKTFRSLKEELSKKFEEELGITKRNTEDWSSKKFKKNNPSLQLESCKYCSRSPVDLHHLLGKSENPDLINSPTNIVPLCTMIHSIITRKHWKDNEESLYEEAISLFKKDATKNPSKNFDEIMDILHSRTYG